MAAADQEQDEDEGQEEDEGQVVEAEEGEVGGEEDEGKINTIHLVGWFVNHNTPPSSFNQNNFHLSIRTISILLLVFLFVVGIMVC